MMMNSTLSTARRWAQSIISLAERSMAADSEWLVATRTRLAAMDDTSLCLLRDVLDGRKVVTMLSESQFDLYFGLQIFLATRQGAVARDAAPDSLTRGARVIARKAEEVFGAPAKARRWLSSPNANLGAAPLALTETRVGRRLVYEELTRIDYGDLA